MKAVFRHVSRWRILVVAVVAGLGVLASPATASAQPSNDNFSNATVISSLLFSDVVDNTTATTEPGEPNTPGEPNQCGETSQHTVWYSITVPSSSDIRIDTSGSSFSDTIFVVYQQTGSGFTGLSRLFCAAFSDHFQASANTTYYIQAGNCCTSGGSLHLNVQEAPSPANDNFANATSISPTALPFTDTVDASGATTEAGEPNCGQALSNSWWYSITPTATESFTATPGNFGATVAAYTGSALSNLSQIGCASGFSASLLTFRATAGTTYYLQMSDFFQGTRGPVTFTLDHAQQPIAEFFTAPGPSDVSIFDTVQFFDNSFDPAQAGIQTEAWDFGDGTTGTGPAPTHRYAADGDYTASLTVTTFDGRTASAQQVIHVSTHDVAITKFTVPTSASAGQTRSITVGVSDKRYPETVQVQLLKGNTQGGFDPVGTLTQSIPVQTGKSTTPFAFSYTFTPSDAAVGKVTFEAIATIQGTRDALPADNTVIASTTVH